MKKQRIDLLNGPIYQQILLFFFPIMLGTFFQQLSAREKMDNCPNIRNDNIFFESMETLFFHWIDYQYIIIDYSASHQDMITIGNYTFDKMVPEWEKKTRQILNDGKKKH